MDIAAAYIRVSLDATKHFGADEIISPATQEDRIRAYCQARGWMLGHVEQDIDESAFTQHYAKRRGLVALLDLAANNAYSHLVVWKFSRIARRTQEFLEIADRLEKHGVTLVSVTEQIDTSTPVGKMMRTIMAGFAELQSTELSEQISSTWLTRLKQGRRPPGPLPYGLCWQDGHVTPDPGTIETVRRAFSIYAEQGSSHAVWHWLKDNNVKSPGGRPTWTVLAIRRLLRNPLYAGVVRWKGQLFPINDAPAVDPELWQGVQDAMDRLSQASGTGNRTRRYLLSGLISCEICGRPFSVAWMGGDESAGRQRKRRYRCFNRIPPDITCRSPMVDADTLEAEVAGQVLEFFRNPALRERVEQAARKAAEKATAPVAREIFLLRTEIGRLTGICDQLFRDHYESGIISREQFIARNREYTERIAGLKLKLDRLEAQKRDRESAPARYALLRGQLPDVAAGWEQLSLSQRRLVLAGLSLRITISPEAVVLSILGYPLKLPAARIHDCWYFGEDVLRLDYQGTGWTDRQLRYLATAYGRASPEKMARKLGRSVDSVYTMAHVLRKKGKLGVYLKDIEGIHTTIPVEMPIRYQDAADPSQTR